ncbi:hypothetical protein AAFF_G00389580 [Aldrovandia affinis]|uniref:Uncharacterized protein n=1 Tax=Aldrovandia affinis TaxID=143900 RepID=A0AAD7SGG3_9TELE|nr:hypothetical protein AAFF_G00389580 [Aldrovandia affinis]
MTQIVSKKKYINKQDERRRSALPFLNRYSSPERNLRLFFPRSHASPRFKNGPGQTGDGNPQEDRRGKKNVPTRLFKSLWGSANETVSAAAARSGTK